ncbi:unnamed protein product [Mucor hiemalis]
MIKKSNNSSFYVPNQCIPFLCVFIIAKTPTVLLVSFVVGYIMLVQPKKKQFIANPEVKMIEASPSPPLSSKEDNNKNLLLSYGNEEGDKGLQICPARILARVEDAFLDYSSEEDDDLPISPVRNLSPVEDNNSSIDFENLMKFPSCPTTLPRLDTHFNFVVDHDIQSPDPSKINWPAIHQEMDCDQQWQEVVVKQEQPQPLQQKASPTTPPHPLLMLHQLQQDNLSMIFSTDELSLMCSPNKPIFVGDAAILHVDNDTHITYDHPVHQRRQQKDTVQIEDLLMLPRPKQSNSSPGQLFKSKFQKAVSKMKKTSNIVSQKNDSKSSKRSSIVSNESATDSESSRFNSYHDPLFSSSLSPRPSASARVHDHLKGRFNKMFKK